MKFLLLASYAESLINFRGHLLRDLAKKGLELHVAGPALNGDPILLKKLHEIGCEVHEVNLQRKSLNVFKDLFLVYELWKLLNQIRPDYFMAYTAKPVIYGGFAAQIAGIKNRIVLITGLGSYFQNLRSFSIARVVILFLYRVSIKNAKIVFFQNVDDQKLFVRCLKLKTLRSVVVDGSGVDTSYFTPVAIPAGKVRFLLAARFLKAKGVEEFLKAATIINSNQIRAEFILCGDFDYGPDSISEDILKRYIDSGVVTYMGYVKDIRVAISACSVFVLPSYREGLPRSVLEAMAMGRPVITTDAPGCKETVLDSVNGYIVPIKSINPLVKAMNKFIHYPESCHVMGMNSRNIAEKRFDVSVINKKMLQEMGL